MHLSILIETMRRQGYEFAVTRPEVILKQEDGIVKDSIEELLLKYPNCMWAIIMEKVSSRR